MLSFPRTRIHLQSRYSQIPTVTEYQTKMIFSTHAELHQHACLIFLLGATHTLKAETAPPSTDPFISPLAVVFGFPPTLVYELLNPPNSVLSLMDNTFVARKLIRLSGDLQVVPFLVQLN